MTPDDVTGAQGGHASHLRPLAELPALRLADGARDLRGWPLHGADGALLGTVRDLLADPDRLVAEFLLVSTTVDAGEAIVPLSGMEVRDSRLVPGRGLDPIPLRYQSTVHLSLWATAVAALLVLAWVIWAFAR
jgi:hypothetical protein